MLCCRGKPEGALGSGGKFPVFGRAGLAQRGQGFQHRAHRGGAAPFEVAAHLFRGGFARIGPGGARGAANCSGMALGHGALSVVSAGPGSIPAGPRASRACAPVGF